jgi:hypothetical protein
MWTWTAKGGKGSAAAVSLTDEETDGGGGPEDGDGESHLVGKWESLAESARPAGSRHGKVNLPALTNFGNRSRGGSNGQKRFPAAGKRFPRVRESILALTLGDGSVPLVRVPGMFLAARYLIQSSLDSGRTPAHLERLSASRREALEGGPGGSCAERRCQGKRRVTHPLASSSSLTYSPSHFLFLTRSLSRSICRPLLWRRKCLWWALSASSVAAAAAAGAAGAAAAAAAAAVAGA